MLKVIPSSFAFYGATENVSLTQQFSIFKKAIKNFGKFASVEDLKNKVENVLSGSDFGFGDFTCEVIEGEIRVIFENTIVFDFNVKRYTSEEEAKDILFEIKLLQEFCDNYPNRRIEAFFQNVSPVAVKEVGTKLNLPSKVVDSGGTSWLTVRTPLKFSGLSITVSSPHVSIPEVTSRTPDWFIEKFG